MYYDLLPYIHDYISILEYVINVCYHLSFSFRAGHHNAKLFSGQCPEKVITILLLILTEHSKNMITQMEISHNNPKLVSRD